MARAQDTLLGDANMLAICLNTYGSLFPLLWVVSGQVWIPFVTGSGVNGVPSKYGEEIYIGI